ncbi:MAG: DUF4837 family protein [Bacteroidales bacterium]|nr:DUF4837 family protein [Bacteroidales bacterium]
MRKILLPLMCLLVLASCSHNDVLKKKGSSGKTLEVLLVADAKIYKEGSSTRQIVDSLFRSPQKGLPQPESKFDIVNIPVSSFSNTEMFHMCRNIVVCNIKSDNPNEVYFNTDRWASPQVVFELAAKDQHSLDSMLLRHYPTIEKQIYRAEHKRVINAFRGMRSVSIMEEVKDQYGFELVVSDEFELAKLSNPQPELAWIRKEAKDFGIGVLLKVAPYTDKDMFREDVIIGNIDSIMSHVEGPADSSYMAIERRVSLYSSNCDFEQSAYAMETRGCWRLFGDFMGGPFVAYTILSPDNKQVITMIAYAYCPRFGKRDYLMQVESICHSITF